MEQRLESLLSSMDGVGEVKVMITLASSSEQIVEKDSPVSRSSMTEADSAGGSRSSQEVDSGEATVYVTDNDGEKIPYVVKEISPRVEGVSVVAAGGGNAYVQKNIIEVIQALFGIEIHKIKVECNYQPYTGQQEGHMNLTDANVGEEYIIKDITTDDEELNAFLFSLGCYSGEPITVVTRRRAGCVVSIKDARYSFDNNLAEAISV